MVTNFTPPAHEQLSAFFDEFFREMRKLPPEKHVSFLSRAEEGFKRFGYREQSDVGGGVDNILIVRLDAIGDMILTSGFIREVRANFPKAHITLVVRPLIFSLVEYCPYVNEVLTFERNTRGNEIGDNLPKTLEEIVAFCREHLWQKKFSVAFTPKAVAAKISGLWMTWLSGAHERIGFGLKVYKERSDNLPVKFRALDKFFLTKNVILPESLKKVIEWHFYVLTFSGLNVNQTHMELFYGAADIERTKKMLAVLPSDCKKVVLGIGASERSKKYPVEQLVVALRELLKKNLLFVIVGGKSELDAATYIEKNLPPEKILNLVDKTTLRETEALIAQMDYYLGNDTGVMHMAAAAKIPVLVIFRVAKELDDLLEENQLTRYPPWQTKSVILRPEHRLGDCATLPPNYIGCLHKEPHCITQITPQEIVAGFEVLQSL